jgi:hypothetical protein
MAVFSIMFTIQSTGYFNVLTGEMLKACLIIQTKNFVPGAKNPLSTLQR